MSKRYDLSVLVPARNEEFLGLTIRDVLENRRARTEVVCLLDGAWSDPPIPDHPDVVLLHRPVAIGQRAATNECARVARGSWIMKLDAHCRVGEGFDRILIDNASRENTYIPRQYNLHAFNWRCLKCGIETYQGPQPTRCIVIVGQKEERVPNPHCNGTEFQRVMVWEPRWNKLLEAWRFDSDLHYQQWGLFTADEKTCKRHEAVYRPEGQGDIIPVMSCLGACWFLDRERYLDLGALDEATGSWGQMGVEIACRSWLSGSQLLCNRKTWFAHLFRTQPGFQFPFPISGEQTEYAKTYSRNFWRTGKWPRAIHPLSWLVERFWPVPGWTKEDLDALKATEDLRSPVALKHPQTPAKTKYVASALRDGRTTGIAYYTDNRLRDPLFSLCQQQIKRAAPDLEIVSASLSPIDFADNYVLNLQRGYLTMFQQILLALSHLDTDFAALCEHDCLYSAEHLSFVPPRRDTYYYDENVWDVSAATGHALFRYRRSVSQLIANRRLLIDHYRERIARIEKEGFTFRNGFEPGTRSTRHGGYDDFPAQSFFSARPSLDIRDHGGNLTRTLWEKSAFRNQRFTAGWREDHSVPGWGRTEGRFPEFLKDVAAGRIAV